MKILFVTSLLLALAASTVYSQTCHLREIDLCVATAMFHYQSNSIPADEEKLDQWCETIKEVGECMSNFSAKCVSPLQKEILGLLSGAESDAQLLCIHGTEVRANYLKHSKCLADSVKSDGVRSILKDFQVMVQKLHNIKYKQRFPLWCCGFLRGQADADKLVNERCGRKALGTFTTLANMVLTDMPSTICQKYDPESDECQSLLPARRTQYKRGENKSHLSNLFETVLGDN